MDKARIIEELRQFTGTMGYHKSTFGKLLLTDGIDFLRNACGCYWLIDIVESVQHLKGTKKNSEFLIWQIEVKTDKSFRVTAKTDTNQPILYEQKGNYTDFPLSGFTFYQINNVLLLQSEY